MDTLPSDLDLERRFTYC